MSYLKEQEAIRGKLLPHSSPSEIGLASLSSRRKGRGNAYYNIGRRNAKYPERRPLFRY